MIREALDKIKDFSQIVRARVCFASSKGGDKSCQYWTANKNNSSACAYRVPYRYDGTKRDANPEKLIMCGRPFLTKTYIQVAVQYLKEDEK